jgi:uncharacterized membrane protein YkvA (DUF1232 family)
MSETGIVQRWKLKVRQLKTETYTLYLAYRDPRVPWYAKLFTAGVVAYALSPIDLIPDFVPVLGYLDDLVLIPLGIKLALKLIPIEVLTECRERAQAASRSEQPRNWKAAVVIISIWLLAIALIAAVIFNALDK